MNLMVILLAGGQSTRMQKDKTQLIWNGKKLIQSQIDKCQKLFSKVTVSGNFSDLPCVPDLIPGLGPIEGVRSVLIKLKNEMKLSNLSILVMPVDMPLITESHLLELKNNSNQFPDYQIIKFKGHELPILFKNSELALQHIQFLSQANNKKFSFKNLIELTPILQIKNISLNGSENLFFLNTNTPEDWNAAISSSNHIA